MKPESSQWASYTGTASRKDDLNLQMDLLGIMRSCGCGVRREVVLSHIHVYLQIEQFWERLSFKLFQLYQMYTYITVIVAQPKWMVLSIIYGGHKFMTG